MLDGMTRHPPPGYFDLLEDLRHAGCPVCRGSAAAARRFVQAFLYESVNDPGQRARWRDSLGFCQDHALLLLQLASADGQAIALLYGDLLARVRDEAERELRRGRSWWRRRRSPPLQPRAPCGVCEAAHRKADAYLARLAESAPDDDIGRAAREHGRGLCLPHLRRGLGRVRSLPGRRRLLEIFARGHDELRAALDEYLRKQDARFAGEPAGPEQGAWRKALLRGIGLPHHRVDLPPSTNAQAKDEG